MADFDYEVIEDVVVIYDLVSGDWSVSNDIQNVLNMIGEQVDLAEKTVIYRDSCKIFEGIEHRQGTFQSFFPITETVLEKALNKVHHTKALH